MQRYLVILEYDGSGFYGWQNQPNFRTVQGLFEDTVHRATGQNIRCIAAGRTDRGVHALGQAVHFDFEEVLDCEALKQRMNFYLKECDLSVLSISYVSQDFHARYSASLKCYRYQIASRKSPPVFNKKVWWISASLDFYAMEKAAELLKGTHDFCAFRSTSCTAETTLRTIDDIKLEKHEDLISISFTSRAFLHNQVRIMVGTLVEIAKERWLADEISKIIESRDRRKAGQTAPAAGLCLMWIKY